MFNFILVLTGVVFAATEVALFWFLWRYDAATNREPVKFTHGSHNLEVVWTILPAATLLFIAIYQMNAWADVEDAHAEEHAAHGGSDRAAVRVAAALSGRRRRAGHARRRLSRERLARAGRRGNAVDSKSMDVLHGLFLPHLRVKQDAVPGMKIPVWFRAKDVGTFDLVCAELCGWGHYKMKGRITIETRDRYNAWLKKMAEDQSAMHEPPAPEEE